MKTMKLTKRLLHNPTIRRLLCLAVSLHMRMVYATSRWEMHNYEVIERHNKEAGGALFMFWHGRLFLMPQLHPTPSRMAVVVSQHVDGELISSTVEYFGVNVIRGSTDKGASQVVRQVVRAIRAGQHVGITPDGPRGPRMCINSNIVAIAKITGAPIIPITFSAANARVLNSWDRFLVPKMFRKGVILCGEPVTVPDNASEDEINHLKWMLENELNAMTNKADLMAGIPPVLPENRNTPPKKRKVPA